MEVLITNAMEILITNTTISTACMAHHWCWFLSVYGKITVTTRALQFRLMSTCTQSRKFNAAVQIGLQCKQNASDTPACSPINVPSGFSLQLKSRFADTFHRASGDGGQLHCIHWFLLQNPRSSTIRRKGSVDQPPLSKHSVYLLSASSPFEICRCQAKRCWNLQSRFADLWMNALNTQEIALAREAIAVLCTWNYK